MPENVEWYESIFACVRRVKANGSFESCAGKKTCFAERGQHCVRVFHTVIFWSEKHFLIISCFLRRPRISCQNFHY